MNTTTCKRLYEKLAVKEGRQQFVLSGETTDLFCVDFRHGVRSNIGEALLHYSILQDYEIALVLDLDAKNLLRFAKLDMEMKYNQIVRRKSVGQPKTGSIQRIPQIGSQADSVNAAAQMRAQQVQTSAPGITQQIFDEILNRLLPAPQKSFVVLTGAEKVLEYEGGNVLTSESRKKLETIRDWAVASLGNLETCTLLIVNNETRVEEFNKEYGSIFAGLQRRTEPICVGTPDELEIETMLARFKYKHGLSGDASQLARMEAAKNLALHNVIGTIKLKMTKQPRQTSLEKLVIDSKEEKRSPWSDLRGKLSDIEATLKQRVKGQDDAVEKVANTIRKAIAITSENPAQPKGKLFFVGPTGVGKTELAKSLAGFVFGNEDAYIRFDMGEYTEEHSSATLIGSPSGYVDGPGQLTKKVQNYPFSVVLFDEIEKAHPKVLNLFLQILDDGRLTDRKTGDTVSFSDTVIIFTSNIGAAEVEPSDDHDSVRKQFISKVKNKFVSELKMPEFFGRFGEQNIVPFNFMTDVLLADIAKIKINGLRQRLKKQYKIIDMIFNNENEALSAILNTVDKQLGARNINLAVNAVLEEPLSKWLLDNTGNMDNRSIYVSQVDSTPVFTFEWRE